MKRIVMLALMLCFGVTNASAERGYIVGVPVLKQGANALPVDGVEEKFAKAYRMAGVTISLKHTAILREAYLADKGVIDAVLVRTPQDVLQFKNLIPVPVILGRAKVVAYAKSKAFVPKTWEDLRGKRIGAVRGTMHSKLAKDRGLAVQETNDFDSALLMLQAERFEVLLADVVATKWAAKRLNITSLYSSEPLHYEKMFHYIHRKHEELVPALSKAFLSVFKRARYSATQ